MTTGYSGKPLAQKLGIKPGMRVWWLTMPDHVRREIEGEEPQFERLDLPEPPVDLAHIFVTSCAALDCELRMLLPLIARDGTIWVSWPKKRSQVPTDITEHTIRELLDSSRLAPAGAGCLSLAWQHRRAISRER